MDQGDIVRGYNLVCYGSGGLHPRCLSCKWNTSENLNTYGTITCELFFFYSLRLTMFSLSSLLHTYKNYLHAGVQKCGMMISPTSLIKHCKIWDYAGPPRVTFQGYHINVYLLGSSSSGHWSTSGILFYGKGWRKPRPVKTLNSNGNLVYWVDEPW